MPTLIEQYRQLHAAGLFRGTAIKGYLGVIGDLVKETESRTILDYGCGKAMFYHSGEAGWGCKTTLYDPGVPGIDKKPEGQFDGVICTDVLEHVENPEEVIAELIGYATKFLFLTISVRHSPPQKRLPDGRPLHITVHPPQWWRERIDAKAIGAKGVRLELRFDEAG